MPTQASEDRYAKAVALTRKHHRDATDVSVQKVLPINQGQLFESQIFFVSYTKPGGDPGKQPKSLVYFPAFRGPMHFENSDEFIKWSAARSSRTDGSFWGKVLEASGGVAGLLAVMITGAIIFQYVRHGEHGFDIPTPLATALGTVLGFYFGGKTKDAKEARKALR